MRMRFVFTLVLVSVGALSGCDNKPAGKDTDKVTKEDVQRDVNKALETTQDWSEQTREAAKKDLEVRLENMDKEIVLLREKGQTLTEEAKANWDKKMVELESKRQAAQAKLGELGSSSAAAWKDLTVGAQAAWNELDKAFRDAASEF